MSLRLQLSSYCHITRRAFTRCFSKNVVNQFGNWEIMCASLCVRFSWCNFGLSCFCFALAPAAESAVLVPELSWPLCAKELSGDGCLGRAIVW